VDLCIVSAVIVTAVAAYIDHRTGFIPNSVTLGGFAFALVARAGLALGSGGVSAIPASLGWALVGAIVCAIAPLVLYRAHALGGGDVKLFIALGAFLGPLGGMHTQMAAFVCGALFAPLRLGLARDGRMSAMLRRSFAVVANLALPRSRQLPVDAAAMTWFRFGPAIFAGTLASIALRWGELS